MMMITYDDSYDDDRDILATTFYNIVTRDLREEDRVECARLLMIVANQTFATGNQTEC